MSLSGLKRLFLLPLALLLLPACTLFYPEWSHLPVHEYPAATNSVERTLLIMLPGRFDAADRFFNEGFVELVRNSALPIDVVAAEAHIAYYYDKTILERIRQDLVIPARQQGYRKIWILGISMGGLGGLWYDRIYPGEIDGLIVLAPYLGERDIVDEIEATGGVRAWRLKRGEGGTFQKDIWSFFKGYEDLAATDGRLFLGYGKKDGYARSNALLAGVIPGSQVAVASGGHDWPTWWNLLARLLENQALQKGLDPER